MHKLIIFLGVFSLLALTGCAGHEPEPMSAETEQRCLRLQARYHHSSSQAGRSSVLDEARKLGCGTMVTEGSALIDNNDHWRAMRERNIGVPGSGIPDTPREARSSSRTRSTSN